MKRTTVGLTIPEVLIAVTLIAILTMIVMTSSRKSVERAKDAVCVSNLRQIAAAMEMYRDDYSAFPPPGMKWPGFLPYLGGYELTCPISDHAADRPNDLGGDYFMLAGCMSMPDYLTSTRKVTECFQIRGLELPMVIDKNHATTRFGHETGHQYYLLIRMNHSVTRVPFRARIDEGGPCPDAGYECNL